MLRDVALPLRTFCELLEPTFFTWMEKASSHNTLGPEGTLRDHFTDPPGCKNYLLETNPRWVMTQSVFKE